MTEGNENPNLPAVLEEGRGQLRTCDKDGLTLIQKKVLTLLVETPNWRQAAEAVGIHPQSVRRWLNEDPAFLRAYRSLFAGYKAEAEGKVASMLPRAGEVLEEALDADRPVSGMVICPECGHPFEATIQAPHWAVRLGVAKDVMRHHGRLTQKSEIEVKGEVVHMTLEDKIALALLQKRGVGSIPPETYQRLKRLGVLEGAPTDTIEGTFHEVESDD
jgi:hypothetical protein